ncbi:unnamed protein product [Ascophyllum nodosum]
MGKVDSGVRSQEISVPVDGQPAQGAFSDHYQLGDVLGTGAFSVVKSATRKDGLKAAVKVVDRRNLGKSDLEAIRNEARLLKELNHPNIVKLHGWYEEPTMLYMAIELCEGGELFDRIVSKTYYTEKEARDVVRTLLRTMKHLHDQNIIHRDLKPENLLLVDKKDDAKLKIADFGFAKKHDSKSDVLRAQCGTPGYVAPEILKSRPYGAPVDMWSIGVITYILLGGYPPFHGELLIHRLFQKIKRGKFAFHEQYWDPISAEAKNLIARMLKVDPEERITAEDALQHSWVTTDDDELEESELGESLQRMRVFNARTKFKSAINSIILAMRLQQFLTSRDINEAYEIGRVLGKGAYSVVKAARAKKTNEEVAVKIVKRAGLPEDDEKALKDEMAIMLELDHPHIIKLLDFFEKKDSYYMVVEKVNGGELFDRIVRKVVYNEKEARDLVTVLLKAVKYCHDRGIVHRDLKPENLLLVNEEDDALVKVADFGFAQKFMPDIGLTTQCGTPGYVAPEILLRKNYDEAVDMWSVGVITYILLGGYPPFHDENQARQLATSLFAKIKKGIYTFHDEYWADISPEAKDLIAKMLTVDPRKRITAKDALEHPYLKVASTTLEENNMGGNLDRIKLFNARRKFKSAIQTVIAADRLKRSIEGLVSMST